MNKFVILFCLLTSLLNLPQLGIAEASYQLSQAMYKSLSEAQKLLEQEKYAQAQSKLTALLETTQKNSYEYAMVQQTLGFLYSSQKKYQEAIGAFERALFTQKLPDDVSNNLFFNLGQLHIAEGQYEQGIKQLESWLKNQSKVNTDVYALLATACYQTEQYKKAIRYISGAIHQSKRPRNEWYDLLLSSHLQLKQYKSARSVLLVMITRQPTKKIYWDQLAALYAQNDWSFRSLAIQNFKSKLDLDEPETIVNLADTYRYLGIPYKSGVLLAEAIQKDVLAKNLENMEKLADSWLAAREDRKAAETLSQMLTLDASGQSHLKLAQVYSDLENWDEAQQSLQPALSMLKGDSLGKAYSLMGIIYFNQKAYIKAREQFAEAKKFNNEIINAEQWMRYIDGFIHEQTDAENEAA